MPDGVVLPDSPIAIFKEEPQQLQLRGGDSKPTAPAAESLDREKADEAIGQLESNMRQLVQGYDSEATESSSGGESCDEFDRFPASNVAYVPIK
jgi:hypothetical protein